MRLFVTRLSAVLVCLALVVPFAQAGSLNGLVAALVGLVEGDDGHESLEYGAATPEPRLKASDRLFHRIAGRLQRSPSGAR